MQGVLGFVIGAIIGTFVYLVGCVIFAFYKKRKDKAKLTEMNQVEEIDEDADIIE